MKDKEFEFNISISIPKLYIVEHLIIISIVLLCFSFFNGFNNIKSIPVTALGITTGYVIFQLAANYFENRRNNK